MTVNLLKVSCAKFITVKSLQCMAKYASACLKGNMRVRDTLLREKNVKLLENEEGFPKYGII